MKFAIVPYSALDPWREITLALVLAGHRVDVHHATAPEGLATERYDAIFTMFLTLPMIRAVTDDPVVVVGWDSVFDEFVTLREAMDLPDGGPILYWLICGATADFVATHTPEVPAFHLPLPVHPTLYPRITECARFEPDTLYENSYSVAQILCSLERTFGAPDPTVVFLGRYDDPTRPLNLPGEMRALPVNRIIDDAYARFRNGGAATIVGFVADVMKDHGLTMRDDAGVIEGLYRIVRKIVADSNRRPAVEGLWRMFGDEFWLFGDEWVPLGLPGRPTRAEENHLRSLLYRRARVSVDLGSATLDTGWYSRTIEIVKYGGRLLQLRRSDSAAMFGDMTDDLTCGSPSEAAERVRMIVADERPDDRLAFRNRIMELRDPVRTGEALVERITASLAATAKRAAARPVCAEPAAA